MLIFIGFSSFCTCNCLMVEPNFNIPLHFYFSNNRVVTESTLARPIPPTPRFDQRRDHIVWSKAAFIIGSNSSLPSCDLPSKPLTSSPVTVQGEGSGVPTFDLSVIKGNYSFWISHCKSERQNEKKKFVYNDFKGNVLCRMYYLIKF